MTQTFLKRAVLLLAVQIAFATAASAACGRDTLKTYYGFYDINGIERCGVIISPQPTYTLVVGEEYWACDGSYTQWGLVCNGFYDITHDPCECPPRDPMAVPNPAAGRQRSVVPIKTAPNGEVCP